ncbi:MAG: two-component regulator propeller domain-containing protein [Bacteroidaceae bacterium]
MHFSNAFLSKLLSFFFILTIGTSLSPSLAVPTKESKSEDRTQEIQFKEPFLVMGRSFADVLSSNEVLKMHQDKEGFIWIATRFGLNRYDGYQLRTYQFAPSQITSRSIQCLADNNNHYLWLGTNNGLNLLNKETGEISSIQNVPLNKNIATLLATSDGSVWIGTNQGLCRYFPRTNTFQIFNEKTTHGILPLAPIKALIQDHLDNIWIGTWDRGLFRYSPQEKRFYAYPKMNKQGSAHVIFEDHKNQIWVGSWGEGLYLLKDPYDLKKISWQNFRRNDSNSNSIIDNVIYSLCEDPYSQTIWIGTPHGLSIMKQKQTGSFINYSPNNTTHFFPYDEVSSLIHGKEGGMWLGTIGGGVYTTNTQPLPFSLVELNLDKASLSAKAVRCLFVDKDEWVWIGNVIARCKKDGSQLQTYNQLPEFASLKNIGKLTSIIQRRKSGELWFATLDGELLLYKKGEKVKILTSKNASFIPDYYITSLMEDQGENVWIGTRHGVGIHYKDESNYIFQEKMKEGFTIKDYFATAFCQDAEGNIWMGSRNYGLIRISGNLKKTKQLHYKTYNHLNQKFPESPVFCLFCDHAKRLWVGTEGNGLYLYNKKEDRFESVNKRYNLEADVIVGIQEDDAGNLWINTTKGLIKIAFQKRDIPILSFFTSADGLQNSYSVRNATAKRNGLLYFGGMKGFNVVDPKLFHTHPMNVPLMITDIKIFNTPFAELDSTLRKQISSKTPEFTQLLTIPHSCNNFSIEFAALAYERAPQIRYAYKLNGYDKEWRYVDGTQRSAHYNNLPVGTYTLLIKGANSSSSWSNVAKELKITVLPPFWATWWAYLIYLLLIAGIIYLSIQIIKNRIQLRNKLQFNQIEKEKAEEMNHAKLQFFTNITHELMTPLSIISASVDELQFRAPEYKESYALISRNINRLLRLLQQILEFRKAESGNLQLRVSENDLINFLKSEIESFRPLLRKKKLHLTLNCSLPSLICYFDPDKVDKILYNLFSNAAKYNSEGGEIIVSLEYLETVQKVKITVADNGMGISEEGLKSLFTRFYEGDYRRFKTVGTGIGLSLTHDLVQLHGGEIEVESKLGEGTSFFFILPIGKDAFLDSQIEAPLQITPLPLSEYSKTEETERPKLEQEKSIKEEEILKTKRTLLLVEDNEELLNLMISLLCSEFHVLTAKDGQEAFEWVEKEEIDLIVSDLRMPVMDGIELCQKVKKNINYSHIPFIILTATQKEEDRAEAYNVGADGYLSKPFNLTVLHAKIRNLLSKKERAAKSFQHQVIFELKDLEYSAVDEDFLQRAIALVNEHLDDSDFDQMQLVEALKTSKTNLYRKLKSLTGLSSSAFIRNIRMKAACKLMSEKRNLRVSDVAYAIGFKDAKYFSTCFRKEFGIQPKEFINRFIDQSELEKEKEES